MLTIDIETLRAWLEDGRPVTVLDVRPAEERAEALYDSLRVLLALPRETLVLPGHTGEPVPFDGIPLTARLSEISESVGILREPRDVFVARLMRRLPPTPPNYQQIIALNERGLWPDGSATTLEAGANRCAIA